MYVQDFVNNCTFNNVLNNNISNNENEILNCSYFYPSYNTKYEIHNIETDSTYIVNWNNYTEQIINFIDTIILVHGYNGKVNKLSYSFYT